MLGSIVFLSPLAGLACLAAVVPVGVVVIAASRGQQAARLIGLEPAGLRHVVARAATAGAICVLLGLAAAQPAVRTSDTVHVRRSSQVLFVVDVSRSMLASDGPHGASRLERAKSVVLRLRRTVPDVPAGVAGLTDRVLPYVLATSDPASFENVVRRSVAIEAPPPRDVARNATSFGALAAVPTAGFFPTSATRRTCVLVSDGESAPYSTAAVASALDGPGGCSLVIVQVWEPDERVYGVAGVPEAAYRPDDAARASLRRLAEMTGGQAFDVGQTAQAGAALRQLAQVGPTGDATVVERERLLSPALAGAALILAVVLATAVFGPARFRRQARAAYAGAMEARDRAV